MDETMPDLLTDDRMSAHLGIQVKHREPGHAVVTMTVTSGMANGHGITHGGAVFALADTAFALACNRSAGVMGVTVSATIDFIAASGVGDVLVARACERVERGRSGLYDVTVCRGDEVIAEFRARSRNVTAPGNRVNSAGHQDRSSRQS
ncbi:hotdog fold thioesterase [Mycolicibacterium monacense]|uniref:Phenylacetic acid degradation protein PaaD n=2 Tax=Mycobacteriaceae TaxID=1762 RepID=A0AAD1MWN9_MYCMB|nr:hotdog fold thioesterase [Mycolicibacterium monacense]MDA4100964.1 phenylacetic acid degradation protein [Mycolicibacterium monacense DSM 44395]ORB19734.1 phenylacetic acid degradation protein PaaD [Mycolicibacterium monacense DSM 44395]QHP86356.1 hotdog fold thioesterase [Mycolicibacterium monacense DSM 44395]BBZ60623.1 phenylacetic acid degradation protein PaaD [Mycolicibacterium monacense]